MYRSKEIKSTNSKKRAQIKIGGVIQTVEIVKKNPAYYFLKVSLILIFISILTTLSYVFGLHMGASGEHTRIFESFAKKNTFGAESTWITLRNLDEKHEKHDGTTATDLNKKMLNMNKELVGISIAINKRLKKIEINTRTYKKPENKIIKLVQ